MSIIDELADQLANFPTERQINLRPPNNSPNSTTMALPQISVRDYLDLIPTFDGNPTKLSTFLQACEEVFPLMAPGNEPHRIGFTMLHIKTKLVGKAAALTSARNYNTFPQLKEILISLFGDQRNEESLLSDLNTLKQRANETPHQFADRCIDIRSLLLAKLSCQEIIQIVKDTKINMYNNFTLRSFITGVNPQLSHLLRCRNPLTIEQAIQIVTDEENLNYHRSKIGATSQNINHNHNKPVMKSPPYQLRINAPQTRHIPITGVNIGTSAPQHKWTPRPFPNKHPFFQQQNYGQRTQAPGPFQQQNYGQRYQAPGPSQQKIYKPTPMEVDSNRTRLSRQSIRPQYYNQPKFLVEELTTQEVEPPEHEYSVEEPYDENEYYEYNEDMEQQQDTEPENFRITASDTQNTNQ